MSDKKSDAPLMIGVSGLRGIVGESLTPEVAMRFAGAFGAWVRELHGEDVSIAIGADGRQGFEVIRDASIRGLRRSGVHVVDCGVQMTPTMGTIAGAVLEIDGIERNVEAAMVVTASHNPQEWNGLKCVVRTHGSQHGHAPSGADADAIISRFDGYVPNGDVAEGDHVEQLHAIAQHFRMLFQAWIALWAGSRLRPSQASLEYLQEQILPRLAGYHVVVDSVNCSGGPAVKHTASRFGFKLTQLHGDNSGIFPHTPEPTAENLSGEGGLCDAVPGLKADVGFAQDPDGDRLAIVDETGRYIGEEYTLALCAVSILEAHKASGSVADHELVLCANLSTSRMIDDIAATYGASVVRTAVGEANVVEAMKRLKREGKAVLLGGEGNGGVIWPEVTYVRDSLGSMALVLSLMARTGKTVSQLVADIPSYAIVKRKQPLANKSDAQPAIERIAGHYAHERVDTQDGVRVDFDQKKAWVHVRASNTEPILRLIGEAHDEATANTILDEVAKLVEG